MAGSLPALLALIAIVSAVDGPTLAAQFAVRQRVVEPSLYGQVFTTAAGLKVGSFARPARAWLARWRPGSARRRHWCWRPACSWRAPPSG